MLAAALGSQLVLTLVSVKQRTRGAPGGQLEPANAGAAPTTWMAGTTQAAYAPA